MKKFEYFILPVILLSIIIFYLSLVIISSNKNDDTTIYSIKTNYSFVYEDSKSFDLYLYSKQKYNLIQEKDENIYKLILDSNSYTLKVNEIELIKVLDYYQIRINSKMPVIYSEVVSSTFVLRITNEKYSLSFEMGSLSIVNKNLLTYDITATPSYSKVDGILNVVGINLENQNYNFITDLRASALTFARLSLIRYELYPTTFDIYEDYPYYNVKIVNENEKTEILSKDCFIPLCYKKYFPLYSEYIMIEHDDVKEYIPIETNLLTDFYACSEYESGGVLS